MPLNTMVVPITWKADPKDANVLVGYASTFGNVDLGGDVVMPGAFDKTISNIKANGIPLLADHMASTSHVLGTIFDAKADTKGLQIRANLSKAPSAQDTVVKMKEGHIGKLSIGYETMNESFEDRQGMRVRLLNEIKLWETSVVVFPMNPEADISAVKSLLAALDPDARKVVMASVDSEQLDAVKAADTPDGANVLSQVLGILSSLDHVVDEAQEDLAAILGVDNPDADDPADPGEVLPAPVALGDADRNQLTQALGWIRAIDCITDEAQESLAAYLDVPNPDADDADDTSTGAAGGNAAPVLKRLRSPRTPPVGAARARGGLRNAAADETAAKAVPAAATGDEPGVTPDEGEGHWDRLKSDALLGNRSLGEVDDATRAALATRLEMAESQLPPD